MYFLKKKDKKILSDEELNNITSQLISNVVCLLDTCSDSRHQSCNILIQKINDLKYLSYTDIRTDEEKIKEQQKIFQEIRNVVKDL